MAHWNTRTGLAKIGILMVAARLLAQSNSLPSASIEFAPLGSSELEQRLATHLQSAGWNQAFFAAEELHAADPENLAAVYYLAALSRIITNPSAHQLQSAHDAAYTLLIAEPAQWPTQELEGFRPRAIAAAYRTLVWIAGKDRDFKEQERLLTLQLHDDPENRTASDGLGGAILSQRIRSRQAEALFHITRAAFHDGPRALPVATRELGQKFITTNWPYLAGTPDGLADFIRASQMTPFPASDVEKLVFRQRPSDDPPRDDGWPLGVPRNDPQRYLWAVVKRELLSARGEAYWQTLKGSDFPKLKGTVTRINRRGSRVTSMEIAISDNLAPEMVLQIAGVSKSKWVIGQQLEFESAVPLAWTSIPTFLMTCEVDAQNLQPLRVN